MVAFFQIFGITGRPAPSNRYTASPGSTLAKQNSSVSGNGSPSRQGSGLPKDSVILLEQIRTLDQKRLRERMGRVDGAVMEKVDAAIAVSFGLTGSHLV